MARQVRTKPRTGWQVVRRPLDARRLVTLGPESLVWVEGPDESVEGAIVRLKPPKGTAAARVDKLRLELLEMGAISVKPLPPEYDDVVVEEDVQIEIGDADNMRQVVLSRASRMKGVRDQEDLCETLNGAMDKAGM